MNKAWTFYTKQICLNFQGVILLEELATRHAEGNRDYIYYLAIGNARLKQYSVSLKYCKAFLQIEPNNQQAIGLEVRRICHHLFPHFFSQFLCEMLKSQISNHNFQEHIRKKMEKETMTGVAVAGGAALVLGGLVGLGFALAKK